MYIEAIWKVLQGETSQWPSWLGYALWADQITVKRNTGYLPYYLLYGQHPLLPFDVADSTFHVLDWPKVTNTKELLALRMQQLDQRNTVIREARERSFQSRVKAVDAYNRRHAERMRLGEYQKGELVLVYNEALENRMSGKGALKWRGPYAVVARRPSGVYVVQELDGSVLKQAIAWKRMKSYVPRQGLEPVVLAPKWLSVVDDIEEDLLRDDRDELRVMMAHADMIRSDLSWFPKPWLLKGEAESEYWQRVYERWMERRAKARAGIPVQPEPEISPEIEAKIEEDKQFWDFRNDITPDEEGELPRWKYSYPRTRELFEWLPWGKPGCFREIQASTAQLTESDKCGIQTLGDPQVSLVESQDIDVSDVPAKLRPGEDKLEVFIIDERVDLEESGGTTFWGNMSNGSQHANGHGNWKGSGSGRGALPPSGPPGKGKL